MVLLSTVVAPASALAEARWCVWTNESVATPGEAGTLRCYLDRSCADNTDCDEGRLCEGTQCVPACTSIRLAEAAMECGANATSFSARNGAPPNIETNDGEPFTPTGVCLSAARFACGEDWRAWERSYVQEETFFLGSFPQRTSAWGQADFDGDGCPDGGDEMPCVADSSTTCLPASLPSSCETSSAPSGTCCRDSGEVTCGSVCEENEDECSTVRACQPTSEFWSCAPLGTVSQRGACLRIEGDTAPVEGLAGYCLFPEFFQGCAIDALPETGCFEIDGDLELNFFEGDCDDDGCPNGYDPAPCSRCDGAFCRTTSRDPRPGCGGTRPTDALMDPIDCPTPDAGTSDAGSASDDAGITPAMDTGPRPTFGGGGGCTCSTAHRASHGAGLLALGLGLAWTLTARKRRSANAR